MRKFTAQELREMWLSFYEEKGHKRIKSASIIPENDPSCLFTSAGMHPLVPYLLGEKHPMGNRLCDLQKCLRTGDIDCVGDKYHLTFFEMLGSWSLGDYFKKEKVAWSFEFLTNPKYLGLKKEEIAVTCFAGNEFTPKDTETGSYWKEQGLSDDQIYYLPKEENWWEINRGPCGPDSEMFIDTGKPKCCDTCSPACSCGKFVEIGNDVYMQYNRIGDTEYIPAKQKNVDCGFGLERCLIIFNQVNSVYQTEVFTNAIAKIEELSGKKYNDDGDEWTVSIRVVADHIRSATAVLGDEKGIAPSNTGAGYVLRRLIRKAIRHAMKLGIEKGKLCEIAKVYCEYFKDFYPEFLANVDKIIQELNQEEEKFLKTLNQGEKEFEKVVNGIERFIEFSKQNGKEIPKREISGKAAFRLYETFGFPVEMTVEMATEKGYTVDIEGFEKANLEHQELARTTSAGSFKGGLADNSEKTTNLHTAVHLMQAGLRKIVGDFVYQKGSNITEERARFDFSCPRALTAEEIKSVEEFVNKAISEKIDVVCEEMSVEEAKEKGALGIFESKYGEKVKVYTIPNYSCEICGGPHANNTGELGKFKIVKEQSSSAGVRRIKAILE